MEAPSDNPLLETWSGRFGLPPFERIDASHFAPALESAMREHRAEVDAIARNPAAPTFENTLAALDASGRRFARIAAAFGNLASSASTPALQAVEREMDPKLAAHQAAILLDERLFARVDAIRARLEGSGLGAEERMLVERVHLDFTMAGAKLASQARARVAEIAEKIAALATTFRQNVLHDEETQGVPLDDERDFDGLPDWLRAAAREAAMERSLAHRGWIPVSRSLVVPFLEWSGRRDLRERAWRLWTRRGEIDSAHDNLPVARQVLVLRRELARLHGYRHFADYALVDRMARTPAAVARLLERVWAPAKAKALAEREALAAMARACGAAHAIEPWDWRHYAGKVRRERYAVDDAEVKPYLALDRMLEAAFDCAQRLFGVRFVRCEDVAAYHPDVRVYDVQDARGTTIGTFLSDNFMRPGKHGGAWMSSFREQSRANGALPVVANNNNFAKAPDGEPTLLSADDLRTLFHEFGHGLHGLLSQVTYERLSGTNVLRDFVELPSQLFEHWAFEPQVLRRHARHAVTGEPIPEDLLRRMRAARAFNQGFETVEYVACALVDMALHAHEEPERLDLAAFEERELARIGMPDGIPMRHRLAHFDHLFGGSSYPAGYYVYLWAEVLDADVFEAFVEAGDVFDPALAARLLHHVYAAGGSVDPEATYRAFRGRDAAIEPMLADRGLIDERAPA